eukprot:5593071-Prymnesium_polylepis.1
MESRVAKRAAAEVVKAATVDAKPAQPGEMESRVPKRAAAEVVKAETVDAKPAQPGREVVHQHQFPSRRCRPSLPSPACSQLDLKRSLGDDSIRGGADSCKVNDAAASPLDHASTGKIPNTDHEAKIARALACSTGPRRFSPGLCQASITGMESFGPTATLPIVDVASRLRARPTRAEDTIDIMQRVPTGSPGSELVRAAPNRGKLGSGDATASVLTHHRLIPASTCPATLARWLLYLLCEVATDWKLFHVTILCLAALGPRIL